MTEDRELCQRCRNECGHGDLAARLATAERDRDTAIQGAFDSAERNIQLQADLADLTLAYTDALGHIEALIRTSSRMDPFTEQDARDYLATHPKATDAPLCSNCGEPSGPVGHLSSGPPIRGYICKPKATDEGTPDGPTEMEQRLAHAANDILDSTYRGEANTDGK
jgi:hypothetical protein